MTSPLSTPTDFTLNPEEDRDVSPEAFDLPFAGYSVELTRKVKLDIHLILEKGGVWYRAEKVIAVDFWVIDMSEGFPDILLGPELKEFEHLLGTNKASGNGWELGRSIAAYLPQERPPASGNANHKSPLRTS